MKRRGAAPAGARHWVNNIAGLSNPFRLKRLALTVGGNAIAAAITVSDPLVEGAADDIKLLFTSELDKVHRIA